MKKKIVGAVGVAILATGYMFFSSADAPEFKSARAPALACPAKFFDKSAIVFDAVTVCGTSAVSAGKLAHAANVTAQWLDNDQDGVADEPRLVETLRDKKPVLVMSFDGFSARAMIFLTIGAAEQPTQDLSASETATDNRRDASQEEIHHLMVNAGWQILFPKTFSDQASENSTLYTEWELAEANGYYSYADPTCDSSCKTVEFFYLATAAYLGSDADLVSDEMHIKNRAELGTSLPGIIAIIENPTYKYPTTMWPNGAYEPSGNIDYFGITAP